jgi:hypothetical protein
MTSTTHRTHLVLWAVCSVLVGLLSVLLAREATVCLVGDGQMTLAEQSPVTWWMFTAVAALSFVVAVALAGLSRARSNQAACPHCGKMVEPRVTVAGELKMFAPGSSPPP